MKVFSTIIFETNKLKPRLEILLESNALEIHSNEIQIQQFANPSTPKKTTTTTEKSN